MFIFLYMFINKYERLLWSESVDEFVNLIRMK